MDAQSQRFLLLLAPFVLALAIQTSTALPSQCRSQHKFGGGKQLFEFRQRFLCQWIRILEAKLNRTGTAQKDKFFWLPPGLWDQITTTSSTTVQPPGTRPSTPNRAETAGQPTPPSITPAPSISTSNSTGTPGPMEP